MKPSTVGSLLSLEMSAADGLTTRHSFYHQTAAKHLCNGHIAAISLSHVVYWVDCIFNFYQMSGCSAVKSFVAYSKNGSWELSV